MSVVTRFAPSPTGRLHLGHAWSAVQAHDFAREHGGTFLLRIEDIDGTRSRPEHVAAILADLEWLGLGWDGEVVFQSERLALYDSALARLKAMGLLYPCFCTRADIAASLSAPHGTEGVAYPGTCRGLVAPDLSKPHCWRLDVGRALNLPLSACGEREGARREAVGRERGSEGATRLPLSLPPTASAPSLSPQAERGNLVWHDHGIPIDARPHLHDDPVLARKDAPASYHLAVTVDDAAQHVTHIVRGKDLFEATHIHCLLQALLDLPTPEYRHHALLAASDGGRLAKRHGAPTLEAMRLAGEDGRALADRLRNGQLPVGITLAKD